MRRFILVMALIVQCFVIRVDGEVNNIVKSKVVFSNQDLAEKNTEVTYQTDKTVLSRNEIFEFLRQQITDEETPKLKELLNYMTMKELRHIDFLIYLMGIYNTASQNLLQSILEILNEDEINYKNLLSNFT